jgi:acyl-[acyl-carrier-protein]-phospholipid O-acyltransferase/long-chain-fatty-acid--[acyl-carrier-protein] ligase
VIDGWEQLPVSDSSEFFLPRAFLRGCRRFGNQSKVADSTGVDLTGGELLTRALVLRRIVLREVLQPDEKFVAVLLPPSVAAVVANVVLSLMGRVVVNLNYTCSSDTLNYCLRECKIRHVLTSRRFLEKMDVKLDAELVFLEDFKDRATLWDKLGGWIEARLPLGMLARRLGVDRLKPDDLLTVIFTSGSTGQPKGVMLSYRNIGANAQAIGEVVQLSSSDVLLGILPMFHCFGYTVSLWSVLALDIKAAYHFSPLEAQQIGKLCQKHSVTIMLSTPTFLRSYLKRIGAEQLSALDVVVAGAEKLSPDLCEAFEQKFGVRPVEGYGATETSPLVSVNMPPSRARQPGQGLKEGTVGRPVPGVTVRVLDPESDAEMPVDQPGMLWVKGDNVMQGYLNQPELTAEVIRDGWYKTGDLAKVDADGFITITGRQSRFSKIGGEMVPHGRVEELLQQFLGGEEQHLAVAVSAVPDARKGERLLVLHTHTDKSPDAMVKHLSEAGLPNLWIPSTDSFFEVEAIPILGTGKLDLQGVKRLATERLQAAKA